MKPEDSAKVDELLKSGQSGMSIGGHFYPKAPQRTSDCAYDCGCWMGPSRSGGPDGVDQFGDCPKNPKEEPPPPTDRTPGIHY